LFDEYTVRNFLSTMGDLCKNWSRSDLEAKFPRSIWFRGSGGEAKGTFDWLIFTLFAEKEANIHELYSRVVSLFDEWATSKDIQHKFDTSLVRKLIPVTTTKNVSVKIDCWERIDKSRVNIPKVGPIELDVFRKMDEIFEGSDVTTEAYQCRCNRLFVISKDKLGEVPKDENGLPLCNVCARTEIPQDAFRQKFDKFAEITKHLLAFELSSDNEKKENLTKLQNACKGWIPTGDLKELYVHYYEMLNELRKDPASKEAALHGLDKEAAQLIDQLFDNAKQSNPTEFKKMLFSLDFREIKEIDDTINEAMISFARLEKDYYLLKMTNYPIFVSELTKQELERNRIRIKLLTYSHLVELGSIYDIVLNLIQIEKGKRFEPEPFEAYGVLGREYDHPLDKIKIIEGVSPSGSAIGRVFRSFYDNHIRNAFAHSQYILYAEGAYLTRYKTKISRTDLEDKLNMLKSFWNYIEDRIAFEEVEVYRKIRT